MPTEIRYNIPALLKKLEQAETDSERVHLLCIIVAQQFRMIKALRMNQDLEDA